jgi:hypothetical protein
MGVSGFFIDAIQTIELLPQCCSNKLRMLTMRATHA